MLDMANENNNELVKGKERKIECRTGPNQDQKREDYCRKIKTAKKRL